MWTWHFQFFDPVSPGSDLEVLNKMFEATKIGGHIVLELDTHNRLISKMENNKLKTWQSFEDLTLGSFFFGIANNTKTQSK